MPKPKESSKITPPYISISKLEKTVSILSARTYSEVSPVIFQSNGYSKLDSNLAINALKFLGLVDEQNKATDQMSLLRQKGDAQKKAFEQIVRAAYKPLFDAVQDPQNMESIDLTNAFNANYPHLSDRVIRTAIPVFIKLCEYAGLKEAGTIVGRVHKPHTFKSKGVGKDKPLGDRGSKIFGDQNFHIQPILKGKMNISIPEEIFLKMATDDVLNEEWRLVLKAAHKFSDKFLQEKLENSVSLENTNQ